MKLGIYAAVAAVLVGFAAFGMASADIVKIDSLPVSPAERCRDFEKSDPGPTGSVETACVMFVPEHGIDPSPGTSVRRGCDDAPGATFVTPSPAVALQLSTTGTVLICVNLTDINDSKVTFDSNDIGKFDRAACSDGKDNDDGDARIAEWPDDACLATSGSGTDHLVIEEEPGSSSDDENDLSTIIVRFSCNGETGIATITITHALDDVGGKIDTFTFRIDCRAAPTAITVTATPLTVEIIPAASNTAHSLIEVTFTPALIRGGVEVDFTTDRCAIEVSGVDDSTKLNAARLLIASLNTAIPQTYLDWETFANGSAPDTTSPQSEQGAVFDRLSTTTGLPVVSAAAAILHCDPHAGIATATPGVANVFVCVDVVGGADLCQTVRVTVIGPPASVTVAASPTTQRCGEKSTITVTVRDAIGQNVSDHTRVEMVTNLGGVLGGTGAVVSFAGPVVPISSTVAGTFGGVATAFLLTSETHSGPYEVVATSGGTAPFDSARTYLGGIFSTAPISAQVTVTCTLPVAATTAPATPAPTITAPRTGTGITPPNTGDAGLASDSSAWTLFAIGGLAAFALAGLATARFARR